MTPEEALAEVREAVWAAHRDEMILAEIEALDKRLAPDGDLGRALAPKVLAIGRSTMTWWTDGERQYIRVFIRGGQKASKPVLIVEAP